MYIKQQQQQCMLKLKMYYINVLASGLHQDNNTTFFYKTFFISTISIFSIRSYILTNELIIILLLNNTISKTRALHVIPMLVCQGPLLFIKFLVTKGHDYSFQSNAPWLATASIKFGVD